MSGANATGRRKPLDTRIPTLIANSLQTSHRSFFLLLGDRAKAHAQIVNLHFLLGQSIAGLANPTDAQKKNPRPNVLWCYKKELGFTSNRKKREGKIKRDIKRNQRDVGEMDPFELFVSVTDVRYTYYKDTHKILGQTFSMLILQDFEAITPNLLARTIETVQGGGIVVCLLQGMKSLRGLYSMTMDVHSRYRSSTSTAAPVARFNERFLLSLGANPACLVVDDELNVLPISAGKDIVAIDPDFGVGVGRSAGKGKRKEAPGEAELQALKEGLSDTKGIGEIIAQARTLDQAKAILTFTDAITSKTLSQTVSLTAARGRGKSAALGLSISLAILHGYSNVFVTSPSPENLKTLFEFIFKGFDQLGWEEHLDYDIVQSTNPEWKGAVVRVNIFRQHRQTIQYIQPQDFHVLGQAELVVIDEAAAIPLPLVRSLLGPYLVFMASTINGYEGTGRSLSLKLLQQLREMSRPSSAMSAPSSTNGGNTDDKASGSTPLATVRTLKEIKLETPIRYGPDDSIEKWLNGLLCLDATISTSLKKTLQGCPHPSTCELFYVNRDTLFSFHPASELFLQRMMSLYVASHYKNSPNDLQLMSDAPGHHLFVLLPPLKEGDNTLPDPLVVMQVALEGNISKQSVLDNLSRGKMAGGDLIPWTISQQYQDDDFASMSGARIVRVAVHPDYAKMGYGSRALQALNSFYSGELLNLDEVVKEMDLETFEDVAKVDEDATLQTDQIAIRDASKMPPLLQRLSERQPENLDYLGVSYGLTPLLFKFWKRAGFSPLYIRQTQNDLTGEHSCVMLRGLNKNRQEVGRWLGAFSLDFRKRFIALLSYKFREFSTVSALSVLEAANQGIYASTTEEDEERRVGGDVLVGSEVKSFFSPFDLKRLDSYAQNMLDYHVILDLLPTLAGLYFSKRFPEDVQLSGLQASILLALGLQRKSVEDVEKETEHQVAVAQCLALFSKTIRKLTKSLQTLQKEDVAKLVPDASLGMDKKTQAFVNQASGASTAVVKGGVQGLEEELDQEGREVLKALKESQREVIDSLDLKQYSIAGTEDEWAQAQAQLAKGSGVISIKNPESTKGLKRKLGGEESKKEEGGKKHKKDKKHKEGKKGKK
ncbi:BQ5605_C009g05533 [Microbotryum silenes-dioicae]|uniref:RNA cytidine acetyltransferase n=1 Tax=Microbotryum silenes-dioicae TaxID=796604 RepID=A0A2X0MGN8_9BASI|nr:BQ5605_C009g05533 [Microbotryum silenes-dioicae]